MSKRYKVVRYDIATLRGLLSQYSLADESTVAEKIHSTYFEEYFPHIGAETIVVENDYVDRDYLEDFSAYYVRCFHAYSCRCNRLHFFDIGFDETDFRSLLIGESSALSAERLRDSYLGFIVVKPLPRTIIGRTCLKTYERDGGRRNYPILRDYAVHLFGTDLNVDTLAFQEQDEVAAACATSALWSTLHGTGMLFHHPILSPVEITKIASEKWPIGSRALPSHGLAAEQMAHAVRSVGLEPHPIRAENQYVLLSTLYAYLKYGIPVILLVELRNVPGEPLDPPGSHAVALTGYSLGKNAPDPHPETGMLLQACRIDKLYAHDDQVGPFARMPLLDGGLLDTSWPVCDGKGETQVALPILLLIPLYHKIRISFQEIHDSYVLPFDVLLEEFRERDLLPLTQRIRWEIYLISVNDLKRFLAGDQTLGGDDLEEVLTEGMPRFLWRATGICNEEEVLDLLFDATDIDQGPVFVRAIERRQVVSVGIRAIANVPYVREVFQNEPVWKVLRWFLR